MTTFKPNLKPNLLLKDFMVDFTGKEIVSTSNVKSVENSDTKEPMYEFDYIFLDSHGFEIASKFQVSVITLLNFIYISQ